MAYYSIGKFAELIGKSEQTLRNGDKKGVLKPAYNGSVWI
jgi:putative resolvase